MRTLFVNGQFVDVLTDTLRAGDMVVEDGVIVAVGVVDIAQYVPFGGLVDLDGAVVCPGFIDGHIHVESTMLTPAELARVSVAHGTTAIMADPHEIANVCGADGIRYMLQASEGLPLSVYYMLPSCVPSSEFDESGAELKAEDLRPFYEHPRVLGLGEVMNGVGVINGDADLLQKIADAHEHDLVANGHAPLWTGEALDRYIAEGINDDHECTTLEEAREKLAKGMWIMIRQGTAEQNLEALSPLFDTPKENGRCLLVSDDRHPNDLVLNGHVDDIIRKAVALGKDPLVAIRMATLQAAQCFKLKNLGALEPGYRANFVVLDSLADVRVRDVYVDGTLVVKDGVTLPFDAPLVDQELLDKVSTSFHGEPLTEEDFLIDAQGTHACRIIGLNAGQIITDALVEDLNFDENNGVDTDRDLLKLAVIERHKGTGHKGVGFVKGFGFKCGAVASSVAHDSHNIIVVGTSASDMALAANAVRDMGGGCVVVRHGQVKVAMPLPIAGLMTEVSAEEAAEQFEEVSVAAEALGVNEGIHPFMNMMFIALPVIPHLKMTTFGLFDYDQWKIVPLLVE